MDIGQSSQLQNRQIRTIRMWQNIQQINYSRFIEWILFFGFCSISVFYMKEAIVKFNNKETSITKYELSITKMPTMTICYSNFEIEYGQDFNISLNNNSLQLGNNMDKNGRFDNIEFERIYTYYGGENNNIFETCFKISSETSMIFKSGYINETVLKHEFKESLPNEKIPNTYDLCLTSEKNAYGAIYFDWRIGNPYCLHFKKVRKNFIYLHITFVPTICMEVLFIQFFGLILFIIDHFPLE